MAMDRKINLRCTIEFEALLQQKMKEAGYKSYSELIRDLVKGVHIKQRCKEMPKLIKEVNKIGVNLNQISRYVNENRMIDEFALQGINDTYNELSNLILEFG